MPTATAKKPARKRSSTRKKRTTSMNGTSPAGRRKSSSSKKTSQRRPVTPEDLLKITFVGDPQVSPDGKRIVFGHKVVGEKNNYARTLWMVDSTGKGKPRAFTSGERDSHPRWSADGETIAFIRAEDKTRPQIALLPVEGGEARILTDFPEGSIESFAWSPDGTKLAVKFRETAKAYTTAAEKDREEKGLSDPARVLDDWWYRLDGDGYFDGQRYHLYLVDIDSGEHECIYHKDTLGFFTYDWAPDSKQIVIATNRHKKAMVRNWEAELLKLNIANRKITEIRGLPKGPKNSPRWSPDGKHIAYAAREGEDGEYSVENLELWVCNATGKADPRCITGSTDYCLLAPALSDTAEIAFEPSIQWADNRSVLATFGWHGEQHIARVPISRSGKVAILTSGNIVVAPGMTSSSGKRVACLVAKATAAPEIYLGEISASKVKLSPRTNLNRDLMAELALSDPQMTWVKTEDGTKVQVWCIKPPKEVAGAKKTFPAVLEIHGGPHAQYGIGLFHEFQMLASAGYAVFFSNPRGSKGYGRDHCAAIRGHWGTADWTDIKAVIEHMKDQSFVDTKRMGVMGGSYGGYMTNWVIGHCNDFAGAITDRCVSNITTLWGTSDFTEAPDAYFPGNSWDNTAAQWNQSPMKYIGNCKTPTLIIHSEGDLRCNVEQAEQLFTALKLLNVPTRFVRYPRSTSHGMSRNGPPDMRMHRLHQILGWWAKYLASGSKRRT